MVPVHLAVAKCFLPPKPGDDYHVDHKNDNPLDNRADNLTWLIKSENCSKGWHKANGREWKPIENAVEF